MKIHRVRMLPNELEASSIYAVHTNHPGEFDIYIVGNEGNALFQFYRQNAEELEYLLTKRDTGRIWRSFHEPLTPNSFRQEGSMAYFGQISGNYRGLHFPEWGASSAYATITIPLDCMIGSIIYPQLFWTPKSNSQGVVRWGLEILRLSVSGTGDLSQTSTIYVDHQVPNVSNLKNIVTTFPQGVGISTAGAKEGDMLQLRLFRDAADKADTFSGEVAAWPMVFHYQVNKLGSSARPGTTL